MDSINLTVHLSAAAAFLAFIFLAVKTSKDRTYMLSLLSQQWASQNLVRVDWPLVQLERFCQTFAIACEGEGALRQGQPRRIKPGLLFSLHLRIGLAKIRYAFKEGILHLQIKTVKIEGDLPSLENDFTEALGVPVRCVFFPSGLG